MNILAIDYGTKRIGLAIAVNGIIQTLPAFKNDQSLFSNLKKIITDHQVEKIYVGLSEGHFAQKTKVFVGELSSVLQLNVETVEEAVSTIEADGIYLNNKGNKKNYRQKIDSVAAAVILRRVIS